MSINTLKKKGVILFGSNVSGHKPVGGIWLRQGPFGSTGQINIDNQTGLGFSINGGGSRNGRYIGKNMMMSKNGTPFRGKFPRGSGGVGGTYPRNEPTMNVSKVYVDIMGNQAKFIKPSTLSTDGMLEKKYMWINNGQYPNNWVQPDNNANLTDNHSQWLYIQQKAAANDCVTNTNDTIKYSTYILPCNNNRTPLSRTTFKAMFSNAGYTKELYLPQTSSQHTVKVQRKCANPIGKQKPFPFAANNNSGGSSGSTNYKPPPISTPIFLVPPEHY